MHTTPFICAIIKVRLFRPMRCRFLPLPYIRQRVGFVFFGGAERQKHACGRVLPLAFAQMCLANTNRYYLRPVCAKSNEITSPAGALLPVPHRLIFFSCRSSFRTPPHEDTSLPDALLPFRPASSFYFLPLSFSPLAFAQTCLANTNRDCLRPVCAKSNEITSPAGALLPVPHRLIFFSCRSSFRTPPHEDTSLPDALLPFRPASSFYFLPLVAERSAAFFCANTLRQNGITLINVINTFMVSRYLKVSSYEYSASPSIHSKSDNCFSKPLTEIKPICNTGIPFTSLI